LFLIIISASQSIGIFLKHLVLEDHYKLWKHLKAKIEDIEEKIKSAAESIKKELHRDIKAAKSK